MHFHNGFSDELAKLAVNAQQVASVLKHTQGAIPGALIGAIASEDSGAGAIKGGLAGLSLVQGGRLAGRGMHKALMKNKGYRKSHFNELLRKAKAKKEKNKELLRRAKKEI